MNGEPDNLKTLYDRLIADKYELPDYNSFQKTMQEDESSRKTLHAQLVKDKYDVPDYNSFSVSLGLKKKEPTEPSSSGVSGDIQSQSPSAAAGEVVKDDDFLSTEVISAPPKKPATPKTLWEKEKKPHPLQASVSVSKEDIKQAQEFAKQQSVKVQGGGYKSITTPEAAQKLYLQKDIDTSLNKGDVKRANELTVDLKAKHPEDNYADKRKAQYYIDNNNLPAANVLLDNAIKTNPNDAEALEKSAWVKYSTNDNKGAFDNAHKALLNTDTQDYDKQWDLASLLSETADKPEDKQYYTQRKAKAEQDIAVRDMPVNNVAFADWFEKGGDVAGIPLNPLGMVVNDMTNAIQNVAYYDEQGNVHYRVADAYNEGLKNGNSLYATGMAMATLGENITTLAFASAPLFGGTMGAELMKFKIGTGMASQVVPEQYMNWFLQPVTEIAKQAGYEPESIGMKNLFKSADLVASILVFKGTELAGKKTFDWTASKVKEVADKIKKQEPLSEDEAKIVEDIGKETTVGDVGTAIKNQSVVDMTKATIDNTKQIDESLKGKEQTDIQNKIDSLTPQTVVINEKINSGVDVKPEELKPAVGELIDAKNNLEKELNNPNRDITTEQIADGSNILQDKIDLLNDAIDKKDTSILKGKEIEPQPQVDISTKTAVREVIEKLHPDIKEPEANLFFSKFKDKDVSDKYRDELGVITDEGIVEIKDYDAKDRPTIQKRQFDKMIENGYLERFDEGRYGLTEKGKSFIDATNKRIETRKGVKEGTDLFPEEAGIPEVQKSYDWHDTLWDTKENKLTPLGEEVKQRVAAGEDIKILTAGEGTPELIKQIKDNLGISEENIKTDLTPEGKATEVQKEIDKGKEVTFTDDKTKNLEAIAETGAEVKPPEDVIEAPLIPKEKYEGYKPTKKEIAKDKIAKGFEGLAQKYANKKSLLPEEQTELIEDIKNIGEGVTELTVEELKELINKHIKPQLNLSDKDVTEIATIIAKKSEISLKKAAIKQQLQKELGDIRGEELYNEIRDRVKIETKAEKLFEQSKDKLKDDTFDLKTESKVNEILNTQKGTAEDLTDLLVYRIKLENTKIDLLDKMPDASKSDREMMQKRVDEIDRKSYDLLTAAKTLGTQSATIFNALQSVARNDYSYAGIKRRWLGETGQKELTKEQESFIKEQSQKISILEREVESLKKEAELKYPKEQIFKEKYGKLKESKRTFGDIQKEIKQKFGKIQESKISPDYVPYMEEIASKSKSLNDAVDNIQKSFKDAGIDLSKDEINQQLISEKELQDFLEKEPTETKYDIVKEIGDAKSELSKIDKKEKSRIAQIEKRIKEAQKKLDTKQFKTEKQTVYEESPLVKQKIAEYEKLKMDIEYEKEKQLLKQRPFVKKLFDTTMDILFEVPRTAMSIIDASPVLRQTLGYTINPTKYKMLGEGFKNMVKQAFSQKNADEYINYLKTTKEYEVAKKMGVRFNEPSVKEKARSEFFGSKLLEKTPFIGKYFVKPSNRIYDAWVNTIRINEVKGFMKRMEQRGITEQTNPELFKFKGELINNMTGTANLGKFEMASPALSKAFFAPRLFTARIKSVIKPLTAEFYTLPKEARIEYVKDMGTFVGMMGGILGIAAMGGAEIETDPRSTNFLKIKIGKNQYLDLLGGYVQLIRTVTQVATGEKKTGKGDIVKLGGYGKDTPLDVFFGYFVNKLAPTPGLIGKKLAESETKPFNFGKEITNMAIPMGIMTDIETLSQENPALLDAVLIALNTLGAGVQLQEPLTKERVEALMEKRKKEPTKKTEEEKKKTKEEKAYYEEELKAYSEKYNIQYIPKAKKTSTSGRGGTGRGGVGRGTQGGRR